MYGKSKNLFVASAAEEKRGKSEYRLLTSTLPSAAISGEVEMDPKGQQRDTYEIPFSGGSPIILTREWRNNSA